MYNYDKVEWIIARVGDRTAAWLDDEPGWAGVNWRDERLARGVPTLLVTSKSATGFTRDHKDAIHAFAGSLR